MDTLFQTLAAVAGLPLLFLGVRSMFAPRTMQGPFSVSIKGTAGLSTIRSVAGGFFFACVTLLGWGLLRDQPQWFFAVAVMLLSVAVGRVVGIMLDGLDKAVLPPLVVEVVLATVLIAAALQLS